MPDQSLECQEILIIVMMFAARHDIDGDPLQYAWFEGETYLGSGQSLDVALALDPHEIMVKITDPYQAPGFDTLTLTIIDTTPPVIDSIAASPNILWPVNLKMVPVKVTVIASDNCGAAHVPQIINVTCNEMIIALGDGNASPDWMTTGNLIVDLRAECSDIGDSLVYTLLIERADTSGNVSQHTVTNTVLQSMYRN